MRKITRQKPIKSILKNGSNCRIMLNSGMLLHELAKMTDEKCAYCETHYKHYLHEENTPEKEHFYPKSKYPNLEDHWWNLFWVCPVCNKKYKKDYFEKKGVNKRIIPLKPDNEGRLNSKPYRFDAWFLIRYKTGALLPNKKNKEWKRAEWSVQLFGLNRDDLLTARKRELERYLADYEKLPLKTYSYSFYIEDYLKIKFKY